MLSIFPELLVFSLAAPLVLRATVGLLFLYWSQRTLSAEKNFWEKMLSGWKMSALPGIWILAGLEAVLGLLLLVGLWTQVAALGGAVLTSLLAYVSRREIRGTETLLYILAGIISLSLAFSGAGFLAFDLPL